MDSLFETNYVNTQPLRKYEPLIRFDSDGNPQRRKPLQENALELDFKKEKQTSKLKTINSHATTVNSSKPAKSEESESLKSETTTHAKSNEDLKRKVSDPPAAGIEPKKKQQKQTSIMNFFAKKT